MQTFSHKKQHHSENCPSDLGHMTPHTHTAFLPRRTAASFTGPTAVVTHGHPGKETERREEGPRTARNPRPQGQTDMGERAETLSFD